MKYTKGRVSLLVADVGSRNYNLHTEGSDRDVKIYCAPSFQDLFEGSRFKDTVTTKELDVSVHDIRELGKQLFKANISFIELLYSQRITHVDDGLKHLYEKREEIAKMNLPYLYEGCSGIFKRNMKNMEKGTVNTQNLVEKFGYDTKAYMNAYRGLDFLCRYAGNNFTDFAEAIKYNNSEREEMLKRKRGAYTKEFAFQELNEKMIEVQSLKEVYYDYELNEDTLDFVNKTIQEVVKKTVFQQEERYILSLMK